MNKLFGSWTALDRMRRWLRKPHVTLPRGAARWAVDILIRCQKYLQHKPGCQAHGHTIREFDSRACTCGLTLIYDDIREESVSGALMGLKTAKPAPEESK